MVKKSSRRTVGIHGINDASRWVFNRIATGYHARPPYPSELVDAIKELASLRGPRLCDIGAGIGHLALPLAERGLHVTAVEPAERMLERLRDTASKAGLPVRSVHASAEKLPFDSQHFDAILIADALHFIDSELAAREIRRVLSPSGVLMILTCDWASTPYMRQLAQVVEKATQRRPRRINSRTVQLSGVAGIPLTYSRVYEEELPVTPAQLQQILATVSFIGPAMNRERTQSFHAMIQGIPLPAAWGRRMTLTWGFGEDKERRLTQTPAALSQCVPT
ncbi:MAG TPA: class I SAM-dependent methyltransferase [Polyangiaceae bacterium]